MAATYGETVGPCAASQPIIARIAIQAVIASPAAQAIGAIAAKQRIGIDRAGQADGRAIIRIADRPAIGA